MKYIVVIPARGGSKRLPHKNILPLAGKPLIVHSIDYAKSELPDVRIVVSTDDNEIRNVSLSNGCIVINRPQELSGDFVTTADTLKHVSDSILSQGLDYDYMILLQCTNPLRPERMLRDAIHAIESSNRESLIGVSSLIMKLGKISENKFIPWNYVFGQRSQELEPLYYENGLIYISSKELISEGIIADENAIPFVINHPYAKIDIDTEEDFKEAENAIKLKS